MTRPAKASISVTPRRRQGTEDVIERLLIDWFSTLSRKPRHQDPSIRLRPFEVQCVRWREPGRRAGNPHPPGAVTGSGETHFSDLQARRKVKRIRPGSGEALGVQVDQNVRRPAKAVGGLARVRVEGADRGNRVGLAGPLERRREGKRRRRAKQGEDGENRSKLDEGKRTRARAASPCRM